MNTVLCVVRVLKMSISKSCIITSAKIGEKGDPMGKSKTCLKISSLNLKNVELRLLFEIR